MQDRDTSNVNCKDCPHRQLCLARSLSEEEISHLNSIIKYVKVVSKGEHIYHQNDKMRYIYAIYSGYCKDYWIDENGAENIDNFYFPGDILGLESIPMRKHTFFGSALTDVKICAIPIDELFDAMHKYPALLQRFTNIMSYKMLNNVFVRMTTNAQCRVASFLLNVYLRFQERNISPDHMLLPMTQIDISHYLGMAYETVNRILKDLQKQQIIKYEDKLISVIDISKLKHICTPIEVFGQV